MCVLLGAIEPPVFAVLVPLVSLKDDPFSAFNLSTARLVGVVAGLVIAVGVLQVLRPTTFAIAAVLGLALLVGVVLRVGNVLNAQVRGVRVTRVQLDQLHRVCDDPVVGDRGRHRDHPPPGAVSISGEPDDRGPS
jgi:hypothetical protein